MQHKDELHTKKSQRLIAPFSVLKKKPLVKLQRLCSIKLKDINAQTKELFELRKSFNKDNDNSFIDNNNNSLFEDDNQRKPNNSFSKIRLSKAREKTIKLKRISVLATQRNKLVKEINKQLLDESANNNNNNNSDCKSALNSLYPSTLSKTGSTSFMQHNNSFFNKTNTNSFSKTKIHYMQPYKSHLYHSNNSINHSFNSSNISLNQSQKALSCGSSNQMKSKYKFISETLKKSIRMSEKFKRNLTQYIDSQRQLRSKSVPKMEKSKKELELEGKYEELSEKMKYKSKTYKGYYLSFLNQRSGKYILVKQGNANLMTYIDNLVKMEDCLFLEFKGMVKKDYPVIQEAADIKVIRDNDQNDRDKCIENPKQKELESFIQKVKGLTYELQMRSNLLIKRLNKDILMNEIKGKYINLKV